MLEAVAPNVIVDKAIINDISEGQRALSPGMKYKHYSPKANIVIVEGDIENFCRFVSENNKMEIIVLYQMKMLNTIYLVGV